MSGIMNHLQSAAVRENLAFAANVKQIVRGFLIRKGFQEFDTPVLMPITGEKYNTTFDIDLAEDKVMLADSPQIYKMLLALAGYEKYFQFAHCFRRIEHEDNIHTRLSEFIQMDVELQNTSLYDLLDLAEQMIVDICKLIYKIPRITYMEGLQCRAQYGIDMKPDLRNGKEDISVVFIRHMPLTNGEGVPCHHIFAQPCNDIINAKVGELIDLTTESFDIVINGIEIGGGDMRIMDADLQRKMMHLFNVDDNRYVNYLQMLENNRANSGGGFAIGLERLVMVLLNRNSIYETVAFPNFYKRGRC